MSYIHTHTPTLGINQTLYNNWMLYVCQGNLSPGTHWHFASCSDSHWLFAYWAQLIGWFFCGHTRPQTHGCHVLTHTHECTGNCWWRQISFWRVGTEGVTDKRDKQDRWTGSREGGREGGRERERERERESIQTRRPVHYRQLALQIQITCTRQHPVASLQPQDSDNMDDDNDDQDHTQAHSHTKARLQFSRASIGGSVSCLCKGMVQWKSYSWYFIHLWQDVRIHVVYPKQVLPPGRVDRCTEKSLMTDQTPCKTAAEIFPLIDMLM